MANAPPTIFADGLTEANIIHGVARLTLGQVLAEGKMAPAGQVIIPLSQLPNLVGAMTNLLRQVETRLKEAQAKPTAPAKPEPPLPSTFSFGNR